MARGQTPSGFTALALGALLLALALSLVSVHIRLLNAGLGCTDWPHCYGQLAKAPVPDAGAGGTPSPRAAPGWATQTHRLLATSLGLLILVVAAMAMLQRGHTPARKRLALLTLAVMMMLAILGIWSAGLRLPAVVLANFAGGILLVGLLWRLLLGTLPPPAAPPGGTDPALRRWLLAGAMLLTLQLLLGGMVSAYFAGTACGTSLTCQGTWPRLPLTEIATLFRPLELDAGGRVLMTDAQTGLLATHRLLGFALLPVLAWSARLAWRSGHRAMAGALLLLTMTTVLLGLATLQFALPPALALGHYAASLALLMTLIALRLAMAEGPPRLAR